MSSAEEIEQTSEVNVTKAAESASVTNIDSEERVPTPVSLAEHFENDAILTLEPPNPPTPKEMLEPLDITPFIR